MVECVISLCTPRLNGIWETRCSLSHDTCLDTALVKGATCARLGEVPNKGRSPVARRIRRRQHVDAISSQPEGVLLKAHNIQILTIYRLHEYDSGDNDTDLASHVMQIRTGEGKSIVLGGCSALLALLGFRVRCVCYSDYLSHRDYSLFENLFMAFGIVERFVYSTIKKFSEDGLQTEGNFCQFVRDLITGNSLESSRCRPSDDQEAGEEILLVDEVDVFFGEDIHGKTCLPLVLFASEEATSLFLEIWAHRAEEIDTTALFGHIQQTEEHSRSPLTFSLPFVFAHMSHRFVARSSLADFHGCGARVRGSPPGVARGAGVDPGKLSSDRAPVRHDTGGSSKDREHTSGYVHVGTVSDRGHAGRRAHSPVFHLRTAPPKRVRRDAPGSGAASNNDHLAACRPSCSLDDSAFPPLDVAAARIKRSLLVSKAISCFARYPDRRPPGLISADDGSLDIHQLWLHWGRRMHLTRRQLLQSITEHTFGSRGRRRFLLRSDEDGRTWVSVSDPGPRFPWNHRRRPRRDSHCGPSASPQVASFPEMILVESDDDVDSVASVHEEFVVDSVSVDGFASDVKLDPAVKLESDPEHEGSKPLSHAVESLPCFPVTCPVSAEFFQGFSFVFTETDDFDCLVVGSPAICYSAGFGFGRECPSCLRISCRHSRGRRFG